MVQDKDQGYDTGASLAAQFQGLEPSDRPRVSFSPLFVSVFAASAPSSKPSISVYGENIASDTRAYQGQAAEAVSTEAIPSMFQQHRATNSDGTKRAHVLTPETVENASALNNTQPLQFDTQPSHYDTQPLQFDTQPSQFDTQPSQFDTQPSQFDTRNSFSPIFQEGMAVPLSTPSTVPIPQPSNTFSGQSPGFQSSAHSTSHAPVLLQPVASFMVQSTPFSPVIPVGFLFGQPPVRETVTIQQVDAGQNEFENVQTENIYTNSGHYNAYDPTQAVCAPCTSSDFDVNESSSLDSGGNGKVGRRML